MSIPYSPNNDEQFPMFGTPEAEARIRQTQQCWKTYQPSGTPLYGGLSPNYSNNHFMGPPITGREIRGRGNVGPP